jgi:hypothetical protein
MLFTLLDRYAKDVKGCRGYDLLGIGDQQWAIYRKKNYLPMKHCKTLCYMLDQDPAIATMDLKELSHIVYKAYWRTV